MVSQSVHVEHPGSSSRRIQRYACSGGKNRQQSRAQLKLRAQWQWFGSDIPCLPHPTLTNGGLQLIDVGYDCSLILGSNRSDCTSTGMSVSTSYTDRQP